MSGNGVDVGAVYQLLATVAAEARETRAEIREILRELDRKVNEGDVATKDDIARLRQTVVEYHSAVIGHSVLISEIDDRLRRVEQHLGFSPAV